MTRTTDMTPKRAASGFQFDSSWVFLVLFLFWAGAFELAPTQYSGQGPFFDGMIGGIIILIYFFCVLLHESGHKLFARMTGRFYDGHQLSIWGGIPRETESFLPADAGEMVVRMGGPLFNLMAGLLFHAGYQYLKGDPEKFLGGLAPFLFFGMQSSFFLMIVNLIPVIPFDMGALIVKDRVRRNPGVVPMWPFQGGLGLSWMMILAGLILASRGFLLSGFGLLFWGIHLARATLVWKGRLGLVMYLQHEDIRSHIEDDPCPLSSGMTIEEAFRDHIYPSGSKFFPVIDADATYAGLLDWREIRKVPSFLWGDRTVGSLELSLNAGRSVSLVEGAWKQVYDAIGREIRPLYVLEDKKLVGLIHPDKILEQFRMASELKILSSSLPAVKKKEDPADPLTIPHELP